LGSRDNTAAIIFAELDTGFGAIANGLSNKVKAERVDFSLLPTILQTTNMHQYDILIVSSALASVEALDAIERIYSETSLPILWFVDTDIDHRAPNAIRNGVTSFVLDGLSPDRVDTLVSVTFERHKMYQDLRQELKDREEELLSRKIIERAKGILMKTKSMSEEDAYKTMRSMAMNQGKTLKDVSKTVIDMTDLLA